MAYLWNRKQFWNLLYLTSLKFIGGCHAKHNLKYLKNKIQLVATYYFFMLMLGSECFGHHYAHHQEIRTIAFVTTQAVWFSICCWLEVECRQDGWVSGPKAVRAFGPVYGPPKFKQIKIWLRYHQLTTLSLVSNGSCLLQSCVNNIFKAGRCDTMATRLVVSPFALLLNIQPQMMYDLWQLQRNYHWHYSDVSGYVNMNKEEHLMCGWPCIVIQCG